MPFCFKSRDRIVQADYTQKESPARNFQLRGGPRRVGSRNLRIGERPQPDSFINRGLTDVFVNRIVRDKDRGELCPALDDLMGLSVRLRIEHLVVIHDRGQQSSSAKVTIDGRGCLRRQRPGEGWLILLCPVNRFRKRDNGRTARLHLLREGCPSETGGAY